jgi:hypothetical protein
MPIFKDHKEIIAASITGACSILGSVIVALLVSHYSAKSTIKAVLLANENSTNISNLNRELQGKQFEETLRNQLEILQLTAKSNLEAIQETYSKNSQLQLNEFKNREIEQFNLEKRSQKQKTNAATIFIISDIQSRIHVLENTLRAFSAIVSDPKYKADPKSDSGTNYSIKKKVLQGARMILPITIIPFEKEFIYSNISYLSESSSYDTVFFYKSFEYVGSFFKLMEKRNQDEEEMITALTDILDHNDISPQIKKEATTTYEALLYNFYENDIVLMLKTVTNGYDALITLTKSINEDTKKLERGRSALLKHYRPLTTQDKGSEFVFDQISAYINSVENNLKTGKEPRKKIAETKEIQSQ